MHRTEFVDGQRADLARDLESRALPGALAPIRIVVGLRSALTVLWPTRGSLSRRLRFRSDRDRATAKPLNDHRVLEAWEPSSAGAGSWFDQRSSGSWWPTKRNVMRATLKWLGSVVGLALGRNGDGTVGTYEIPSTGEKRCSEPVSSIVFCGRSEVHQRGDPRWPSRARPAVSAVHRGHRQAGCSQGPP